MADCATAFTLSCVRGGTNSPGADPPAGDGGGAGVDSGPGAPEMGSTSQDVREGGAGLPVRPHVGSF
jgi:hypothetical protein